MTITEFLEARIAEDEAAAERGGWHNGSGTFANDNYGCLLVQPARVLAECAAKRAIIAEIPPKPEDRYTPSWHYAAVPILQHLAAVYADHPDYNPEWA